MRLKSFFPSFTKNKLFVIDYKILNFFGNWPGNLINLRSGVLFLSGFLLLFTEIYFFCHFIDDVQKIFTCLHEMVTVVIYITKMTILLVKRKKIKALISKITMRWNKSIILFIYLKKFLH